MRLVNNQMPLPYFKIDKKYHIIDYSPEAMEAFSFQSSILDFVEEGSKSKVEKWVTHTEPKHAIELNVVMKDGGISLADAYVNWMNDLHAEVILMEKQKQNEGVQSMLQRLQERLNETDFALLEEKEKVEETLRENYQLSAPCIRLTNQTSFVPLFGNLNEQKMSFVKNQILHSAHSKESERMLFDFTAVGEITSEGFTQLQDVFTSIEYMGKSIIVIGVKPPHARQIHQFKMHTTTTFLHSLEQAIHQYCT